MTKIFVIDVTVGHTFECESEEGAEHYRKAIELLGHQYEIRRVPHADA